MVSTMSRGIGVTAILFLIISSLQGASGQCYMEASPAIVDVNEDASAGLVVAQLSLVNAPLGDTISFVHPDTFIVDSSGQLVLNVNNTIDVQRHINYPSFNITVASSCAEAIITITTHDTNQPPANIFLDGDGVTTTLHFSEKLPKPITLTTSDADVGQTHVYSLGGNDADLFEVVGGNMLRPLAGVADYETAQPYGFNITITSMDEAFITQDGTSLPGGKVFTKKVRVFIDDVAEPPQFSAEEYVAFVVGYELEYFTVPDISATDEDSTELLFHVNDTVVLGFTSTSDVFPVAPSSAPIVELISATDPTSLFIYNTSPGVYNLSSTLVATDGSGITGEAVLLLNIVILTGQMTTTTFVLYTTPTIPTTSTSTSTTSSSLQASSSQPLSTTVTSTSTTSTSTASTTSTSTFSTTSTTTIAELLQASTSWTKNGDITALIVIGIILLLILAALLVYFGRKMETAAMHHNRYATIIKNTKEYEKQRNRQNTYDHSMVKKKRRLARKHSTSKMIVPPSSKQEGGVSVEEFSKWIHARDVARLTSDTPTPAANLRRSSADNVLLTNPSYNDNVNSNQQPEHLVVEMDEKLSPLQGEEHDTNENFLKFSTGSLFQVGLRGVQCIEQSTFTEQDILTMYAMCENLDRSNDTQNDLENILLSTSLMSENEIKEYAAAILQLFDAKVPFTPSRLVTLLTLCAKPPSSSRLQFLFNVYDSSMKGSLHFEEVQSLLLDLHSFVFLKKTVLHPPPATLQETVASTMSKFGKTEIISKENFIEVIKEDELLCRLLEIVTGEESSAVQMRKFRAYSVAIPYEAPLISPLPSRPASVSLVRTSLTRKESIFFAKSPVNLADLSDDDASEDDE